MGGGKKGKKGKSTQSKKGKTKESTKQPPAPQLAEGDQVGQQENVSSLGDLPVVEKTLTDLHLEEETEQVADIKNNNQTPPTKSQPKEAQSRDVEKTETVEGRKISLSPGGLDRRKSLSNLEISSPPSVKKDPTVVEDRDSSVNYNNNVAQKEDNVETPKKLVPMKHSLEHSWTLWWFSSKNKDWKAEEVISFKTIEDFWAAMNWTQPPSKLGVNCDYAVFKEGTKPDWEDRNNSLGGRWIIERTKMEDIDMLWRESLFILIGEHLGRHSDQINGALIQKKRGKFKLAFWLKDSGWERRLIGDELRKRLNIRGSDSMEFRVHKEEQKQRQVGRQSGKFGRS